MLISIRGKVSLVTTTTAPDEELELDELLELEEFEPEELEELEFEELEFEELGEPEPPDPEEPPQALNVNATNATTKPTNFAQLFFIVPPFLSLPQHLKPTTLQYSQA